MGNDRRNERDRQRQRSPDKPGAAGAGQPGNTARPRTGGGGWHTAWGFGVGAATGVVLALALGLGTLLTLDEAVHRHASASGSTAAALDGWLRVPALHDDSPVRPPAAAYQLTTRLLDGADVVTSRLTPANARAMQLMFGYLHTAAIHAATKLGVFDALHERALTLTELTTNVSQCMVPPASAPPLGLVDDWEELPLHDCRRTERRVERLLRYLLAIDVVKEFSDGRWKATAVGDAFASAHPHSLRGAALNFGNDQFYPFALLDGTVRTGLSAYEMYHGEGQFERHRSRPDVGRHFDETMRGLGGQFGDNTAVAHGVDWTPYRHVMEVGGGSAALLRRVLAAHPHLRGTLFDQPNVIDRNRMTWNETCDSWSGGCAPNVRGVRFAAGDFFDADSLVAAATMAGEEDGAAAAAGTPWVDAFVLKQILHDWSDSQALRILRAVHAALTRIGLTPPAADDPAARDGTPHVLVVDRVMGPRDTLVSGSGGRAADLVMLGTFGDGARERSRDEFHALFAAAGFRVVREWPAAASAFGTFVLAPQRTATGAAERARGFIAADE